MSTTKNKPLDFSFGVNLKKLRNTLQLTQKDFANKLSITGSYVSDMERGKSTPSGAVINEIISEYRTTREWLESSIGQMLPNKKEKTNNSADQIDLSHESESFTMKEMVTMTIEILESDTVYRCALASNIRAFHKGVSMEAEMESIKEELAVARTERKQMVKEIGEMKQMLIELGATIPQKRDKEANS